MGKGSGFGAWLMNTFPTTFKPILDQHKAEFDSVYIDVNPILHSSVHTAPDEAEVVKRVFNTLDEILHQYLPKRVIYMAMDGPAPLAKLLEQRRRRLQKRNRDGGFRSVQITPGCPFMLRMEEYLYYYACRYLQNPRIPVGLKVVIDGSSCPGEGEAKIANNLVTYGWLAKGACAIVSSDPDVILQAIAIGLPNIYVLQKPPLQPARVFSVQSFMMDLEQLFPGKAARTRLDFVLLMLFSGNDYLPGVPRLPVTKIWDTYIRWRKTDETRYLVDANGKGICLEVLAAILKECMKPNESIKNSAEAIKKRERRTHNRKLKMDAEKELSKNEEELRTQGLEIEKGISGNDEDGCDEGDVVTFKVEDSDEAVKEIVEDMDVQVEITKQENTEKELTDNAIKGNLVDDNRLKQSIESLPMVFNSSKEGKSADEDEGEVDGEEGDGEASVVRYLEGLIWCLGMYVNGKCPDYYFTYSYHRAPLMKHIVKYADETVAAARAAEEAITLGGVRSAEDEASAAREPLPPLVCALVMLPVTEQSLLHPIFQLLFESHNELIATLTSKTFATVRMQLLTAARQSIQDAEGITPLEKHMLEQDYLHFKEPVIYLVNTRNHKGLKKLPPAPSGYMPLKANIPIVVTHHNNARAMSSKDSLWADPALQTWIQSAGEVQWPFRETRKKKKDNDSGLRLVKEEDG